MDATLTPPGKGPNDSRAPRRDHPETAAQPDHRSETYLTLFASQPRRSTASTTKAMPLSLFPNLDFPQLTDPHDDEPGEGDSDRPSGTWSGHPALHPWIGCRRMAGHDPARHRRGPARRPRLLAAATDPSCRYMLFAERAVLVMFRLPAPDAGRSTPGREDRQQ
jgi:hypothetical protein